jgi:hypothetical protein
MILLIVTSITGYSQDTQMKFMGFSMGMSSSEVMNLLTSQDQISAFGYKDNLLSKNDKIELFKNWDTLIPYHENRFRFNCLSYKLGTPNPNINDKENRHFELKKLIFNQLEIKTPSFVFEGDNLVGSTGYIEMLYSDYNELVSKLDKKYGKGVYNNRLTSWKRDGNVITLWQPSYESWNRNKKYKIPEYQYKTTNSVGFQFYSLSKVQECINRKNKQYETEENELIQVTNDSYKLLGISLGISKVEFVDLIEKKAMCFDAFISYNQSPIQDLREDLISNDSVYFLTHYKNNCIRIKAIFAMDKLTGLSIDATNVGGSYGGGNLGEDMYSTIKKFIVLQKPSNRKQYEIAKGYLIDNILYQKGCDSMYINYNISYGTTISLTNTCEKYTKREKFKSDISTFIKDIDKGSLIDLQILGSYFINDALKIPNDYNYRKINQATSGKLTSTYLLRPPLNKYYASSINKIDVDKGSIYFCYISEVEVMKRNDSIIATSFSFRPSNYGTNPSTLKEETTNLLIKELNSKYGAGIEKNYSDRKSIYWIVNNKYIFEIILNGTHVISNTGNIYLSYRLKESGDMILKHKENKGLLD